MKKKNNMTKKQIALIWSITSLVIALIVASVSAYAYFYGREYHKGSFNIEVASKGVDTLLMSSSDKVYFEANATNFMQKYGKDLHGDAEVSLSLETTKSTSTYCYEVTVELPDEVVFEYSKPGVPELLLDVSYSSNGRDYNPIISKKDITTEVGDIIVRNGNSDKQIIKTTKGNKVYNFWKARLTLVWLRDVNQAINDYKTYEAVLHVKLVDC